jgi:23S rRNA (uracil1939-C5)-methyltransferase
LSRQGLTDAAVEDIVAVAPFTRRRAVFKLAKRAGAVLIGFHARRSHAIVDMLECRVLTPRLTALAAGLREMMAALLNDGETAEIHVTQADNGFDAAIRWQRKTAPALIALIAPWASKLGLARVTANGEIMVELAPPVLRIAGADIRLPPLAFLQPTREGEAALQKEVVKALAGAKNIADLFSGCGTFALALAARARVHAVELDGAMLDALSAALRAAKGLKPVTTEKRDLFKRPLTSRELARFDAVVLDPPRSGAAAQVQMLAQSKIARIAYVSCDAASFARDARVLTDHGYRMGAVTPVDQFLWSDHIELTALFERT